MTGDCGSFLTGFLGQKISGVDISRSIEVRVEKCLVNVKSKIKQFTINLTATYPYWKADETIRELALLISNVMVY